MEQKARVFVMPHSASDSGLCTLRNETRRSADTNTIMQMAEERSLGNGSSEIATAIVKRDSQLTVPSSDVVGAQLVDPRSVRKHNDPYDLVTLAQQVQQADDFVKATTTGKLQVVVEQIRFLQLQARKILEEAQQDAQLTHTGCNFVRIPGHSYHLYLKQDGTKYWSMLSVGDWGGEPPHTHLGSYRFEHDRSWTKVENIPGKERDFDSIQDLVRVIAQTTPSSLSPASMLSIQPATGCHGDSTSSGERST